MPRQILPQLAGPRLWVINFMVKVRCGLDHEINHKLCMQSHDQNIVSTKMMFDKH